MKLQSFTAVELKGFKNVFKLNSLFTELEGGETYTLLGRRVIHMYIHVNSFTQRCQITADLASVQAAVIKCHLKSVVERNRSA